MPDISISYLNGRDVDALALTDGEIVAAVESGLSGQGNGETNEIGAARRSINVLRSDAEPAAGARRGRPRTCASSAARRKNMQGRSARPTRAPPPIPAPWSGTVRSRAVRHDAAPPASPVFANEETP